MLEVRWQHDRLARHGHRRCNDRRLDGNMFNDALNNGRRLCVMLDRRRRFHNRRGDLVRRRRHWHMRNLQFARLHRFGIYI